MEKTFDRIVLLDDDVRGKVHKLISRGGLRFYNRFLKDPDSYRTSIIAYVGKNLMQSADIFTGEPKKLYLNLSIPTPDSFPTEIAVALLGQINARDKTVLLLCDQTWSFEGNIVTELSECFLNAFHEAKNEIKYEKIVAVFYSSVDCQHNNLPHLEDNIVVVPNTVTEWRWEDILSSFWRVEKVLEAEIKNNA